MLFEGMRFNKLHHNSIFPFIFFFFWFKFFFLKIGLSLLIGHLLNFFILHLSSFLFCFFNSQNWLLRVKFNELSLYNYNFILSVWMILTSYLVYFFTFFGSFLLIWYFLNIFLLSTSLLFSFLVAPNRLIKINENYAIIISFWV